MSSHTPPPQPPEGNGDDRRDLPIDIYGIKTHLPLDGDGAEREPPKTWKDVWGRLHGHLKRSIDDVFGLLADVVSSARDLVQGVGGIGRRLIPRKPTGEIGARIEKARQLADAAEGQRQEQAEAARADRSLPAPSETENDAKRRATIEKIRGFYELWKSRGAIGAACELADQQIVLVIGEPGKVAATIADLTAKRARVLSIDAWIGEIERGDRAFVAPEVRVMPMSEERKKA